MGLGVSAAGRMLQIPHRADTVRVAGCAPEPQMCGASPSTWHSVPAAHSPMGTAAHSQVLVQVPSLDREGLCAHTLAAREDREMHVTCDCRDKYHKQKCVPPQFRRPES